MLVTPADLRAAVARKRIPLFKLAALVDCHPVTLGRILGERKPLRPEMAEKILTALGAPRAKNYG
jgi:hypothetical protein